VLSGGGARAAYEVGVLKAIFEGTCPAAKGLPLPEVFCGSGAGAFNAAVICSRLPGQFPSPIGYLQSLWADEIPQEGRMRNNRVYRRRLDWPQFFDLPFMWRRPLKSWIQFFGDAALVLPELARRTGRALSGGGVASWLDLSIWHDISPMRRLITESVNLGVIRDGETDTRQKRILRVVATERGSGQPKIFTNAEFTEEVGYLAILASCALPVIFPAVTIQGKEYIYGGLVMQTPLQPAIDAGCDVIYVIHNEPKFDPRGDEPASALDAVNRSITVALASAMERDLDARRRINALAGGFERMKQATGADPREYLPDPGQYRRVVVHQFRPKRVLGGRASFLNFSRENIEAAIAEGERDAANYDLSESIL